ncbi:branched-chain amino acid transport system II carrier protein [Amedibacillus sp. YH-ame6]
MKKLKISQLLSISLMLFAIFFGAGNMIFPPAMGQLAGENFLSALFGFILTDAGIAILGITAVVLVGNSMSDLGNLIGKKFALFLSVGVYLLIGPLFALPRTGSVSYEIALLPYIGGANSFLISLLFTAVFFGVTYYLSSNPNKIVDVVGKYLTPILLLSIAAIFVASLFMGHDSANLAFGEIGKAQGEYATIPFFKGMVEGYNALDGPAGLAFSIIVISAIKGYGIKDKKLIAKYTVQCGLGAAFFLAVVYFALTYVGAITGTPFANGGSLLHAVTNHLFGGIGGIVLGVAVLFACLTTSIGLTTSFSDYFQGIFPKWSYKKIAFCVCLFSFIISNVGLNQLITISLPILIMIYPVTVILMLLSFLKKYIGKRKMVYVLGMVFTFVVAFVNGLESAGITLGVIGEMFHALPFYELSIGWILPGCIGALLGCLPIWNQFYKEESVKAEVN